MRWRSVWLTACSGLAAVALGGCGGSDTEPEVAGPTIERATAERLAELSDEIGRSLAAGETCAASEAAARLREGVTAAINDGKVPTVYLEDLSGLTNEIEAQIPACAAPAPPRHEEGDEDDDDDNDGRRGKKDEKRKEEKKNKKDKGGDKTVSTETEPGETDTVETTSTETETTTTTTTEITGTTTGPER